MAHPFKWATRDERATAYHIIACTIYIQRASFHDYYYIFFFFCFSLCFYYACAIWPHQQQLIMSALCTYEDIWVCGRQMCECINKCICGLIMFLKSFFRVSFYFYSIFSSSSFSVKYIIYFKIIYDVHWVYSLHIYKQIIYNNVSMCAHFYMAFFFVLWQFCLPIEWYTTWYLMHIFIKSI